jgi:hypothetical protein
MEYRGKHHVEAFERGRKDGRAGIRNDEQRDWAEKPKYRRAYSAGFSLGVTECVLGRAVMARPDFPEVL